jgi:uncharacterized protein (DUF849 family)
MNLTSKDINAIAELAKEAQTLRNENAQLKLDAQRYRTLQSLDYPEACRIMQYLKPEADKMLDAMVQP